MSYYYYRNDCTECCGPEPEFQSEEGRAKRRKGLRQYGTLSKIQAILGIAAVLSGGATIGLAIPNPGYPYLSCLPFVCGVLMCVVAYFGRKASLANVDTEVPMSVKKCLGIHYGISIACCSLCAVAAGNGGWGLGLCLSDDSDDDHEDPDRRPQCWPEHDVKMAFSICDMALNLCLCVTAIFSSILFCKYARSFGLGGRMQRVEQLENEVRQLRSQVYSMNAQAHDNPSATAPPPPYYSQPPSSGSNNPAGQGGFGKFDYGMGEKTQY